MIDAEQAVLGALASKPESYAQVADWLRPEDFTTEPHRVLYRAIGTMLDSSLPCDAITIGEWLSEQGLSDVVHPAYVTELALNDVSVANVVAYGEIVAERSRLRTLADYGTAMVEKAQASGATSADIVADMTHKLTAMVPAKSRGALVPVKPIMQRLHAEMARRYEAGPGMLGLLTPWAKLNTLTKGLRDGVLYVIGARPSMGKSVFGGNIAVTAALAGHRVAWFSAEMTAEECMSRAIAAHGDIPFEWVEQPRDCEDSESFWARQTAAVAKLLQAPLLIDDTPGITIDQLMARARREHMRQPLRLIVIDHMHDMGTARGAEARHEYGRIAQGAKTLAKELNCPVVVLAQLNRALQNRSCKRPSLTDLRESGEIEQKADVILFLHRDDYYDTNRNPGVVELIPAKGRNLKLGDSIHLHNRFDRMRLDEWDGPVSMLEDQPAPRGFERAA